MLTRIRIRNFKLLREVDLTLSERLTVLIGPNASGKSTVLEVVDFLRRCAEDGLADAVTAHGGFDAIRTVGCKEPVEVETWWKFRAVPEASAKRTYHLRWLIRLVPARIGAVVAHESLRDGETELVTTTADGRRDAIPESGEGQPVSMPKPTVLAVEALRDPSRFPAISYLRIVVSASRYLGVVATSPPWTRASPERVTARDSVVLAPEPRVGPEGVGLANALYNLQTDHPDAWATLERAFCAEFPFVRRITFPADAAGSKIAIALDDKRFSGRKIYANQMSDGMIVFLTLLVSVLYPEQRAVLALDEPDAHLHPSALRRLIALCRSGSSHRRIVLVTHSNALLDALGDDADAIRVVEPTAEGARVRSLDAAALAAWREDYTLSEMRRTGLLDSDNAAYEAPT